MPNPCAGVPGNAWCAGGKPAKKQRSKTKAGVRA